MRKSTKLDARAITQIALLMALEIILTRFVSIQTPIVRIGFGFLPSAMVGMLFGPWIGGTAGILTDLAGIFLSGGGLFFPGFTLSAFLGSFLYGLFLYRKPKSLGRIILAVLTITVFVNLGLNTLWIYMLSGEAVMGILPIRLLQNAVTAPIRIALIYFVANNSVIRKVTKMED